MRLFVTGATGFAGGHLVEMLLAEGHTVTALVHAATSRHELAAGVTAVAGDLLDEMAVLTAVAEAQPDVIYHLAGQAYPARSWQMPGQTIAVNTVGTANVLHAAARWGSARVVVVTSADMYGPIDPEMLPITEQTPPQPRHPYGVSKLAAAQLAPLYWERFGLEVVEARPFNHLGPGQGLGFVAPDFASQIAAIKRGDREKKLLVGNLEALRDFTDVRDVARAYMALAERGVAGETYLIASGRPIPIQQILTTLIELAEIEVQIEEDVARLRPSDTPCLYASYAKLERQTGWQPQISLRQSLADVLAEWLA
ncbi:MAG: NAD-dependent epimerase/dehydratase family protein [Chloroflexi bacterium]|nr:GDP-mannose 4,6-dehydratase [Ardenticatenaceae bacterium]MBL1130846.1 NAD-dependent epimerase/dehydratase family protein [Chloroflexota bacterium]NOG36943.1 NAD-dependent epimerase/dehydratase family protein [Chloroflexota bacterium]GIK57173.1 MAG: GDP-mannose 4,6-dehydratase [Chloroflexota bacterium]